MKKFGLIGHPLSHSFSKKYFEGKFKTENLNHCSYELFDVSSIELLPKIIASQPSLIGLNVTIPYKEQIVDYLDEIDENAQQIGAVNTIKIDTKTRKLKGFNTDYFAFKQSLKPFLQKGQERALILGTGGASKAVDFALKNIGIQSLFVSRTPRNDNEISYKDINQYVMKFHQIIINTTPLGMFPNIDKFPHLPYELLTHNHLLYDLVYNPEETIFLTKGKHSGCITINGMQMLKLQAEKSWEIWNE